MPSYMRDPNFDNHPLGSPRALSVSIRPSDFGFWTDGCSSGPVDGTWRVWGLGFRVEGLGFRVEGLGFRV